MLRSFPRTSRARLVPVVALLSVAALPAVAGMTIGWRTDGSGSYAKADPPLEWSTTKSVVWCTNMPGYGVSQPVLLGKRVFISSEPFLSDRPARRRAPDAMARSTSPSGVPCPASAYARLRWQK